MDIYDGPYFNLNKKMLSIFGLWPYDSRKKIRRIVWPVFMWILNVPHAIGLVVNFTDIDKILQHLHIFLILLGISIKHITVVIAENKMRSVFSAIANNWLMITDKEERKILVEYSHRGRILTIAYATLLLLFAGIFVLMPLIPEILNAIDPLPVPRAHVYMLLGEFLVENNDDYYVMIYLLDSVSIATVIFLCAAIDSMYTASGEHLCALFAIVTHRLSKLSYGETNNSQSSGVNSYEWVVHTIKLHQIALSFTTNINESYSLCFFYLLTSNIVALPAVCVIIIISLNHPVNLFRYVMGLSALMLHVFVLFWPGQKLIDHSSRLLEDAYCNQWYEHSEKTKKLLRIFMLRCSQPCLISAGGLIDMNFENYSKVVKTAASYVTVLSSLR